MSGHAYSRSTSPSEEFRDHTEFLRWELMPDERVGMPMRSRRRWPRAVVVAVLAMAGGGWAMIDDKPAAISWMSSEAASGLTLARSIIEGLVAGEAAPSASPPMKLASLTLFDPALLTPARDLPSREVAANPVAAPVSVPEVANEGAAEAPSAEGEGAIPGNDKPVPLPPLPPLTDPLQKKAEAVGLHPELSRAVLESFTATDFRNAAFAIKKAIAETPEDGVLIWPAKAAQGLARFRVQFVPGVSPACRRYVVGVAKSGWLTTALPMERCGVKPRLARSHAAGRGPGPNPAHP